MSKLLDGLLDIKNTHDSEKSRKNPSLPNELVEKHLSFLEDTRLALQSSSMRPEKTDIELLPDSNLVGEPLYEEEKTRLSKQERVSIVGRKRKFEEIQSEKDLAAEKKLFLTKNSQRRKQALPSLVLEQDELYSS